MVVRGEIRSVFADRLETGGERGAADDLVFGKPEDALGAGVAFGDAAGHVLENDAFGEGTDQRPVSVLAFAERFERAVPKGNVAEVADDAGIGRRFGAREPLPYGDGDDRSAAVGDFLFEDVGLAAGLQLGFDVPARTPAGRHQVAEALADNFRRLISKHGFPGGVCPFNHARGIENRDRIGARGVNPNDLIVEAGIYNWLIHGDRL